VEQKRLEALARGVKDNLQYYSYLEPITRRLNAPGAGNFVRGKEFSDMLARLDECLEYMGAHVGAPNSNLLFFVYRG
jgi:conserved oligomeric Golgi complex subunit 3